MKIVIFEPHPDDLLFGVGHIIFDWIEQKYDIHVITVTDGRACYRKNNELAVKYPEEEVAKMRINEAKHVMNYLRLPIENLHLLYFHDAEGQKYVKEGIKKIKPLIKDAHRIVLPSNNNLHIDHQATHDIAKTAAKELDLKNAEFWVYSIPIYATFKEDSKDKFHDITLSEELKQKLQEWLQIYQSQKMTPLTWKLYTRFLNTTKKMRYAIYKFEDIGKYYNF